jgi:N-acetylglutamate synthase-like GNAT family acetyltransferase
MDPWLDITFAPAALRDLPAIVELLARCGLPSDDLRPADLDHFVVCRGGEALVGVAGVTIGDGVGLLRSLAVEEPWRRRGLAHELTRWARGHARRRGVRRLYLLLAATPPVVLGRLGFREASLPEAARAARDLRVWMPPVAGLVALMVAELGGPDEPTTPAVAGPT